MQNISFREKVLGSAAKQYHTQPECLWPKYPKDVVLRHSSNNKWYGLLMNIPRNRLGLEGEEFVDILNVKADPVMAGAFLL
ncbi:hypothetical protein NXH76_14580 [Blautia schinkii]|nr:hypothetical protein [Blautia schinkii]